MQIRIDNKRIYIDEKNVAYDLYYFDTKKYERLSQEQAVAEILSQWAQAISLNEGQGQALYLPFALDDESVECFEATQKAGRLALRCVSVVENGYSVDIADLAGFMTSEHHSVERNEDLFGEYGTKEAIDAFLNPIVPTDGVTETASEKNGAP